MRTSPPGEPTIDPVTYWMHRIENAAAKARIGRRLAKLLSELEDCMVDVPGAFCFDVAMIWVSGINGAGGMAMMIPAR